MRNSVVSSVANKNDRRLNNLSNLSRLNLFIRIQNFTVWLFTFNNKVHDALIVEAVEGEIEKFPNFYRSVSTSEVLNVIEIETNKDRNFDFYNWHTQGETRGIS